MHAVHSLGTTASTKSAAPDPPQCQRPAPCYDGGMEKDKDKDDEPKPVADYWINPAFKQRQPGPKGIFIPIRTGGKPVAKKDDQPK